MTLADVAVSTQQVGSVNIPTLIFGILGFLTLPGGLTWWAIKTILSVKAEIDSKQSKLDAIEHAKIDNLHHEEVSNRISAAVSALSTEIATKASVARMDKVTDQLTAQDKVLGLLQQQVMQLAVVSTKNGELLEKLLIRLGDNKHG